jgi:hypothetical protein
MVMKMVTKTRTKRTMMKKDMLEKKATQKAAVRKDMKKAAMKKAMEQKVMKRPAAAALGEVEQTSDNEDDDSQLPSDVRRHCRSHMGHVYFLCDVCDMHRRRSDIWIRNVTPRKWASICVWCEAGADEVAPPSFY